MARSRTASGSAKVSAKQSVPDEYELYNVTNDPYEQINLAYDGKATERSRELRPRLHALLQEQRTRKCLQPRFNQGAPRVGGEGDVTAVAPEPGDRPAFAQ